MNQLHVDNISIRVLYESVVFDSARLSRLVIFTISFFLLSPLPPSSNLFFILFVVSHANVEFGHERSDCIIFLLRIIWNIESDWAIVQVRILRSIVDGKLWVLLQIVPHSNTGQERNLEQN